jgi:hypothetical protein
MDEPKLPHFAGKLGDEGAWEDFSEKFLGYLRLINLSGYLPDDEEEEEGEEVRFDLEETPEENEETAEEEQEETTAEAKERRAPPGRPPQQAALKKHERYPAKYKQVTAHLRMALAFEAARHVLGMDAREAWTELKIIYSMGTDWNLTPEQQAGVSSHRFLIRWLRNKIQRKNFEDQNFEDL